jgi:hypothetical protein
VEAIIPGCLMCTKLKPPADKAGGLFFICSNYYSDRAGLAEGHAVFHRAFHRAFHRRKTREGYIQVQFAAVPKFLQHVYPSFTSDLKVIVGDSE